jgi:hybrid cluster-associated redox disulfide protein
MEKKIITENTLIMEAVEANPNAPEILLGYGMHCLGCAIAHGETIGEAAQVHGIDVNDLLRDLNK